MTWIVDSLPKFNYHILLWILKEIAHIMDLRLLRVCVKQKADLLMIFKSALNCSLLPPL